MSKKYIIQKDLPELKAGVVFEYNDYDRVYISEHKPNEDYTYFKPEYVENNPEWFLPYETAEFGKWIPVSERNPISPDDYIVTFEDGRVTTNRFNSNWWWPGTIAWQPRPKPYKP